MSRKSIVFTDVNTAELIDEAFDMYPAPGKAIIRSI